MENVRIMLRLSKLYLINTMKYLSFKYVVLYQYFGLSQGISIGLHRELIKVNITIYCLNMSYYIFILGETETKIAFEKHFAKEIKYYGPVCVINLVDQSGKEKIIWDTYSHHIFQYNSPYITYVTFDFHEYW